jgi:CarD family transcriptional regulator
MKASTPAKGPGRRASAGKAAGKPTRPAASRAKKAAAPAKQASATRRVPVPRQKPKTSTAKSTTKRPIRQAAAGARSVGKSAPAARRGAAKRPKPAAPAKRPAAAKAPARKPAAKTSVTPSAKRPTPAKAPPGQKATKQQRPSPAAKVPPAPKAAAKAPAGKPAPSAPKPPAASKPASKPPAASTAAAPAKPKPPPRSEAGSSAAAPVRVAPPPATPVEPLLHRAAPVAGLAGMQAPAPTRPAAPPMTGSPGLARALPNTHFVARRETLPIQPPMPSAKPVEFKSGDHVVYPTHGVGTVQGIETMSAAGYALQVIVVTFDENRMTLRVPVGKAASSGLRKLASGEAMAEALDTLRGRARVKRTMWSRRAQEYEAKINSGDPVQIAEVVRDLHRNAGQPDQSFSERQIYEQALDRLAAELAAIDRTDKAAATEKLLNHLNAA